MKVTVKRLNCQVCGAEIPEGGVFYVGRTEIISGSDGILSDDEESGEKIIEEAMKELIRVKSEQEYMEEVYQEIKLILCGRCRLAFRDRIL
ncbi:MAG: hypothetical protein JRF02_05250, partial [Deltaproteobacteria bacterium]|nr:hypothetical protein [Deltaproteobacteria bacterium]